MAVKPLTVRVDESLLRAAKMKALETDITMTEVVTRMLASYVAGKINVPKREAASG